MGVSHWQLAGALCDSQASFLQAPTTVTVARHWQHLRDQLLDLLYPPRCISCQRVGSWLCTQCQAQMERVVAPFCERCGDAVAAPGLCARCRAELPRIEAIRSVFFFEGVTREAIHRFKYDGLTALAVPLAALMVDYWRAHPLLTSVVVPVPLHTRRLGERGYNQAALLARELVSQAGLQLDERTLMRQRATAPQVDLDAEQRRENMRGAFRAQGQALAGQDVLLVDDVCTTGATLEACAVALYDAGARSVRALTLARAR